jgi:hypothetical protein
VLLLMLRLRREEDDDDDNKIRWILLEEGAADLLATRWPSKRRAVIFLLELWCLRGVYLFVMSIWLSD